MAVRTTIDIPESLHDRLRHVAQQSGSSIRALIVRTIEEAYSHSKKGAYVRGPLIKAGRKPGPKFPADENPHDFISFAF
jgi:hypothetical protein